MKNHTHDNVPHWTTLDPSTPVSDHDVAHRWSKSSRTLQRWRKAGYGPPFMQIGGSIFYRLGDVLAFEAQQRRGGGSDR